MSNLDDKLRDILTLVKRSLADDVQPWVIPQIKAAFADDAKQKLMDGSIHGVGVYEVEHQYTIPVEWEYVPITIETTSGKRPYPEYPPQMKRVTKLRCLCGEEIER